MTLFGVVDTGVRTVMSGDGGTVKSLTSESLSTRRLGFRGVEDIDGGLKAGFSLESETAADTGTLGGTASTFGDNTATSAAKFFNRRSTISLAGPLGEARLGRDYVLTHTDLAIFDAYGAVGMGSILNIVGTSTTGTLGSGAGTPRRADDAIQYLLPANPAARTARSWPRPAKAGSRSTATTAMSVAVSAAPPVRWKSPVPTAARVFRAMTICASGTSAPLARVGHACAGRASRLGGRPLPAGRPRVGKIR